jgi:D-serine deaminase-like pyridoxal phosphate-dependent protein
VLLKQQIPTPALLVNLDALDQNLALMSTHARHHGKLLRPHAKAHKSVDLARRQLAAGAAGLCVATVPEAELFSQAGIPGLLLTSPLADPLKFARAVATGAMVVVDHLQQINWYQDAAYAAARHVDVLIDLDVGDHRTGASPDQTLALGLAIARSTHLRLKGFQAYSVSASHAGPQADPSAGRQERRRISEAAFQSAAATQDALRKQGLLAEILSGGSTGTWDIDAAIPPVTELQAGSYALMDLAYRKLDLPFRHALTVLTTVVSASHDGFVTVDGGFKAFSTDRGYGPEALSPAWSIYKWAGDEFGILDISSCAQKPRLGDKIEFLPPHCDPTVNLYDRMYACRGDEVEAIWPIMARVRIDYDGLDD